MFRSTLNNKANVTYSKSFHLTQLQVRVPYCIGGTLVRSKIGRHSIRLNFFFNFDET
jgi:hypothetical protein